MQNKNANRKKTAFTLIEILVSLAITAILLSAVAMVFSASLVNYQENQRLYESSITARQAMERMTSQLRTAIWVDPYAPDDECDFITHLDGDHSHGREDIGCEHCRHFAYSFDSENNRLVLLDIDNDTDHILCENVTGIKFRRETATQEDEVYVRSVQIKMTVGEGSASQTLTGAAVVRKELER